MGAESATTLPSDNNPSLKENLEMMKATRGVITLCVFQLIVAFLSVILWGKMFFLVMTIIFASLGLAGAKGRKVHPLVAHFIFSLVLYFLSIFGTIAMILYCNCPWWFYVVAFVWVFLQASGIRGCRVLIGYSKKYGPLHPCRQHQHQQQLSNSSRKPLNIQMEEPEYVVYEPPAYQPMPPPQFPQQQHTMGSAPMPPQNYYYYYYPMQPMMYPQNIQGNAPPAEK